MENLKFRTLNADEIECRVGTVSDNGVSLLMYKDARVDMRLLDEVVGCMNWKREHQIINGNLYCTVSIYNAETKEWVSKQDVGVESNTEKEKGQASDAFKRACFNWGIGRELYTCPFVWVNLEQKEWKIGTAGKKHPVVRFYVDCIEYDGGKVVKLVIKDEHGRERYTFPNNGRKKAASSAPAATKNNPNLSYEDKLNAALMDVDACKDVVELRSLYFAYEQEYKNDKVFIEAVNKKKAELEKK